MIMFRARVPTILLLLGCLPGQAQGSAGYAIGFALHHLTAAATATRAKNRAHGPQPPYCNDGGTASPLSPRQPSCRNGVVLYASNNNKNNQGKSASRSSPTYTPADDGRSVGFVLLGMSLLLSAWLFTIPPSFRRAYLCPSDYFANANGGIAQQQQEQQADCVPWGVWWSDVFEYYRNGGGVQWDFSVDPQTIRDNQAFLDAVVTSYSRSAKSN
jgi:hypothetical protein